MNDAASSSPLERIVDAEIPARIGRLPCRFHTLVIAALCII